MKNTIYLFLLLFLMACGQTTNDLTAPSTLYFFDLKTYFQQEIKRLANQSEVKKSVEVNGQKEAKTIQGIDFQKELKVFSDADINRPAWSDKYSIDSIFTNKGALLKLTYLAQEDKLKTKKIEVDFERAQVSKVTIENWTSSAIAETKKILIYQPQQGYSIRSNQDVKITGNNEFLVEVQF